MAPMDYSKWDNIDTDSEPEALPQQAPAPKTIPTPAPAPPESQSHSGRIQAVIVRCDMETRRRLPRWQAIRIPADHAVFSLDVAPVPGLIDIPLAIYRMGTLSADRADLDNQIATYLSIDPVSGFAPDVWQSHVGTVLIARKDRKPLPEQHFEGVWMYCDYILDLFGDGQGAPTQLYNRPAFERWWRRYCEEEGDSDRVGAGDWRVIKSPYDL